MNKEMKNDNRLLKKFIKLLKCRYLYGYLKLICIYNFFYYSINVFN